MLKALPLVSLQSRQWQTIWDTVTPLIQIMCVGGKETMKGLDEVIVDHEYPPAPYALS